VPDGNGQVADKGVEAGIHERALGKCVTVMVLLHIVAVVQSIGNQ
jgi:hypothetical protein